MTQFRYLVTDSKGFPLAQALLDSPPDAKLLQFRLPNRDPDALRSHEYVQLVAMSDDMPDLLGHVVQLRQDRFSVEPSRNLGGGLRQNLRIPVRFSSYIYPLTGGWKGRLPIISCDLSCGGIAFFCEGSLEPKEQVETVIPVTSRPLILKTQIIRSHPSSRTPLYSAKFVDLLREEDAMVCEAVFSLQLQGEDRA